jgi:hypothetical protein
MSLRPTSPREWRDATLFGMGLVFAVNEVFIRQGPERPTVLLLIAGMIGLPAFLRGDERRNGKANGKAREEVRS